MNKEILRDWVKKTFDDNDADFKTFDFDAEYDDEITPNENRTQLKIKIDDLLAKYSEKNIKKLKKEDAKIMSAKEYAEFLRENGVEEKVEKQLEKTLGLGIAEQEQEIKKIKTETEIPLAILRRTLEYIIKRKQREFKKEKRDDDKEKIALPKGGRLISDFITDVIKIFETKARDKLFYRHDIKNIVKISKIKYENIKFIGFESLEPNGFITLLEEYATPGYWNYDKPSNNFIFVEKSISNQIARIVLESEEFKSSLLQIGRIFYVPIPMLYDSCITLPKKGYDSRFKSWTLNNSPEIKEMGLTEAKALIDMILKEFCFKNEQDKINAIAGLLTPYLRGLYKDKNIRTPIFFYIGNRERVGKDYLAGISGIVFEGFAMEEPPIKEDDELRKKILSVFINGRKRFHSSNNKGFLNSSILESVSTAKVWSDRLLGKNENLVFDNDLELSLSGNVGTSYTPDLANRSIFVRLFLDIEDANAREFNTPNLHSVVYKKRNEILSALYTLIKDWHKNGCPKGSVAFTSYPEWAEICGGIMENAGYENPCKRCESVLYEGDSETIEMKILFDLCYSEFGDKVVKIEDIRTLAGLNEIMDYLDFDEPKGKLIFGKKIGKYMGRILNDIRMLEQNEKQQGSKKEVKFVKI